MGKLATLASSKTFLSTEEARSMNRPFPTLLFGVCHVFSLLSILLDFCSYNVMYLASLVTCKLELVTI